MTVLNGEEGLECEVCVDGIRLDHVSEFKYLGCVLDESGTDKGECSRKVASGRKIAGAVRSLANCRSFELVCARVLHNSLLVPVLAYDTETLIWKEKERSRIRDVQTDNLRGMVGIRSMDKGVQQSGEVCGRKD